MLPQAQPFSVLSHTHSSCLSGGLPEAWKFRAEVVGEAVLASLFHVPMLKASFLFIHSFALERPLWPVLGAGERRFGLDNKRETDSSSTGDFRNADPSRQAVFCPFYRRDLRFPEHWLQAPKGQEKHQPERRERLCWERVAHGPGDLGGPVRTSLSVSCAPWGIHPTAPILLHHLKNGLG